MSTQEAETGVGAAARQVAEHASALAKLELELAGLELKKKIAALGLGAGLLIGAAVFGLLTVGFGLSALAAGIATAVPTWAALLIVTGALGLLVALLCLLGLGRIKQGTPLKPVRAIEEAKKTTDALRSSNGDG